jgi:Leucine-rich repeat (LRR) protein
LAAMLACLLSPMVLSVDIDAAECEGAITQGEYDGLEALYNSTYGDYWLWNPKLPLDAHWSFPSNLTAPCGNVTWDGLICSPDLLHPGGCSVIALILSIHGLVGTLPAEFSLLSRLELLEFSTNRISGELPSTLATMEYLEFIQIGFNHLSGQIPLQIYDMTQLKRLVVVENYLASNVSNNVGTLTSLQIFDGGTNYWTGTIPSQFGKITDLVELLLYQSFITGTLPSEITVVLLDFTSNLLTNTIPSVLFEFQDLQYFQVNNNFLSGNFPDNIGDCINLQYLDLASNLLTGTISTEIWRLGNLSEFVISNNLFSGSLATELDNNTRHLLRSFSIDSNYFTSYFPTQFGTFEHFQVLTADSNYLTSSIPSELGNCVYLQSTVFAYNYLSGELPLEMASLIRLQNFNVSHNKLTGNLAETFFYGNQSLVNAAYIDISANSFLGSIPEGVFIAGGLRKLRAAVFYSNCFTGQIPSGICTAANLTALVLDSVSSADACNIVYPHIFRSVFRVKIGKRHLHGSIPECIWEMPRLQTLHVSGNGLAGTLNDLSRVSPSLNDISLASNTITGTIPLTWQTRPWTYLDLSGNKLTGLLNDQFTISSNNTMIDLTTNRLSGMIPDVFQYAANVEILEGNLFQCTDSSKPVNDPDSGEYVCGSSDYNTSLIVFGTAVIGVLLFGGWHLRNVATGFLTRYHKLVAEATALGILRPVARVNQLLTFFNKAHLTKYYIVAAYLGICLVSYIVLKANGNLKSQYSTHYEQYAWITTISYLHGVVPFVLVVIYMLYNCVAMAYILGIKHSSVMTQLTTFGAGVNLQTARSYVLFLSMLTTVVLHIAVMICVNVGYIYLLLTGLSNSELMVFQASLSIFKLLWNNYYVAWAIKLFNVSSWTALFVSTFMVLFTFICGPILATFFSDTSCFRYIITGQASVTSSFDVNKWDCSIYCAGETCVNYCAFSPYPTESFTTVVPSWQYSYQCSSRLLINYGPVLLYSYAISGIFMPLVRIVYFTLSKEKIEQWVPKYVRESIIEKSILTYRVTDEFRDCSSGAEHMIYSGSRPSHSPRNSDNILVSENVKHRKIFNVVSLLSRLNLNIGVLFTFGMACPLLAVSICIDSYALLVVWMGAIGRYLQIHRGSTGTDEQNDEGIRYFREAWNRLEVAVGDVPYGVDSVMWMIVVLTGWFWSLFIFDMMADVYGDVIGGSMVLFPTVVVCGLFFVVTRYNDMLEHKQVRQKSSTGPVLEDANQHTGIRSMRIISTIELSETSDLSTALLKSSANPILNPQSAGINEQFN